MYFGIKQPKFYIIIFEKVKFLRRFFFLGQEKVVLFIMQSVCLTEWATVLVLRLQSMISNSLSATFLCFLSDQSLRWAAPAAAGLCPRFSSLDVKKNKVRLGKDTQRRTEGGESETREPGERDGPCWEVKFDKHFRSPAAQQENLAQLS